MFNFPVVRKNRGSDLLSIDNWLDEFFKAPLSLGLAGWEALPAIDIYEKDDKITVRAEIPGASTENLNISVDDDLLTISGEKKYEKEVKEKEYYRLESAFGKFQRTVRLPQAAKAEGAKAAYKDGVLNIELQKADEIKKKQIKVELN